MSIRLALLALFLIPALWLPLQQTMAQQSGCSYEGVRVSHNQLLACDAEEDDGWEVAITPPPPSVLRLALDDAVRTRISSARPQHWPIRAMLWNGLVSEGALWAEFDAQGNIVRSNFAPAGAHLAEYQRNGAPVWLGDQRVYSAIDPGAQVNADSVSRATVVLVDGQVCPARPASTGYAYHSQDSRLMFLSGNCRNAIQRRIGAGEFWIYPEDLDAASRTPATSANYWTVQSFNDKVAPLIDAAGTCVLYCDAPPRAHSDADGLPQNVPALPALDLNPPPADALRVLPEEGEILEQSLDQASPAAWPIRALFNSRAGIFEFDRQGNLLAQNGKTNVRAVKIRYGEMDPSIKAARQHVYWLIGSRTMSEVNEASAIDSGIVLAGQRACPAQRVAEAFRILHGHAYGYLNGNCAKAVKRTLGAGEFWVYPEDRNVDHPQYWVVQYFHQPEAPIVDAKGHCWLYCDKTP